MLTLSPELNSVRYIKLGSGGQWWKAAQAGNEVHIGWNDVPTELLVRGDIDAARQVIREYSATQQVGQCVAEPHD